MSIWPEGSSESFSEVVLGEVFDLPPFTSENSTKQAALTQLKVPSAANVILQALHYIHDLHTAFIFLMKDTCTIEAWTEQHSIHYSNFTSESTTSRMMGVTLVF